MGASSPAGPEVAPQGISPGPARRTRGADIKRVAELSVADFRRDYSAQNEPVILRGCVDHWPAAKHWNLDYFAQRFSDKTLSFSGRQWRLGAFIEELRHGAQPAPYLNQVKLKEQFQELYADLGGLKYSRNNMLDRRWIPPGMRIPLGITALFIGGAGSGFGMLHWDTSYLHVFISQIYGDKDFVIYAPADSAYLYPRPDVPNASMIEDFNHFDPNEYPNVAKATPLRFTLQAGETVFIPAGWWHATQMRGISISIAESTLDKSNWRQRYQYYLDEYRKLGASPLKRALTRLYMWILGLFVT